MTASSDYPVVLHPAGYAANDKEWLDCELVTIGCSKEEDDKMIYKAGFCDSLKIMKLLGI